MLTQHPLLQSIQGFTHPVSFLRLLPLPIVQNSYPRPNCPVNAIHNSISHIATTETPLHTELRHFVLDHLHPHRKPTPSKRQCIKIHHVGKALTQDEVLQRMKDAEDEMTNSLRRQRVQRKEEGPHRRHHKCVQGHQSPWPLSMKLLMKMRLVMMQRARKTRTWSIALAVVTDSLMLNV